MRLKHWIVLLIAIIAVAAGWLVRANTFNKSPITEAAHHKFAQHLGNMISMAESMPANRYGYAPAESDRYFLEIVEQAASDAMHRCGQLVNSRAPDFSFALKALPRPKGRPSPDAFQEEFKKKAVNLLKRNTDLCDKTFALLDDSQLNELVTIQGDQKATKAEVLMDMLADVAKDENEMDMYLQFNTASPNPK